MTDGDPIGEVSKTTDKDLLPLSDKMHELMEGQKGERFFRIRTDQGTKIGRIWNDDSPRPWHIDQIIKRKLRVSVITLFDADAGALTTKMPVDYEEIVVIRAKHKDPWVFFTKNSLGTQAERKGLNLAELLPRDRDRVSIDSLNEAAQNYKAKPEDLERFNILFSDVGLSDQIPAPNFLPGRR